LCAQGRVPNEQNDGVFEQATRSARVAVQSLSKKGLELWVDRDRVCYRAPRGRLLAEEVAALRERRSEILTLLREKSRAEFDQGGRRRLGMRRHLCRFSRCQRAFNSPQLWAMYSDLVSGGIPGPIRVLASTPSTPSSSGRAFRHGRRFKVPIGSPDSRGQGVSAGMSAMASRRLGLLARRPSTSRSVQCPPRS
jgi:hypothetical protein